MAEKYNRMLKAGIPKQGVEQAMRQDGCDQKMIQLVLSGGASNGDGASNGADGDFAARLEKGGAPFKKYMMMVKAGVPQGAIEITMKRDGVTLPGDSSSASSKPAAAPAAASGGLAGALKQGVPLKKTTTKESPPALPTASNSSTKAATSSAPVQSKPAAVGSGGVMGELNKKLTSKPTTSGPVATTKSVTIAPSTSPSSLASTQSAIMDKLSNISLKDIDSKAQAAIAFFFIFIYYFEIESTFLRLVLLLIFAGAYQMIQDKLAQSSSSAAAVPSSPTVASKPKKAQSP